MFSFKALHVHSNPLSKHPLGSLRELLFLSFPTMTVQLSTSTMMFFDRFFLARFSPSSLDACVNAAFLAQLFQLSLIYWTGMTQVFVGQCIGSGQLQKVGAYVWQMIWFSLFTTPVILPLGYLAEFLFFRQTSIQEEGSFYFRLLIYCNALWPLGSALASFFLGRGKMVTVLWVTVIANLINIFLDYFLIFGLKKWIPPLGILGAALATCISQGFLCIAYLFFFLRKENQKNYGTHRYHMVKNYWWQCLKIGFFRSLAKMVTLCAWLANYRLMTLKGGDYLLVLSMTSTLSTLYIFTIDGMSKGLMTVASYLIGKMDGLGLIKLIRSAFFYLLLSGGVIFFPCYIFPEFIFFLFFKHSMNVEQTHLLVKASHYLWCFFIAYGMNQISFTLLSSAGDTLFTMIYNLLMRWPLTYFTMVLAMNQWQCSPDKYYLILSIAPLISSVVYLWRFFKKKWVPLIA